MQVRREIGGIALLVLMFSALLIPAGRLSAQDQVFLNTGDVLQGKVSDPGRNYIILETGLGNQRVQKRDIARVVFGRFNMKQSSKLDRVELRDGRVIEGEARTSYDGKSVIVRIPGAGEGIYRKQDVVRIIPRGTVMSDRPGAGPDEIKVTVEALMGKLSFDGQAALDAEVKLKKLGVFALSHLKAAVEKAKDDAVRLKLQMILRSYALKTLVGDTLDDEFPEIYQGLEDPKPQRRIEALKGALIVSPVEAIKLVSFVLETPTESNQVRSFCVELLRRMNCYRELIEVYNRADGALSMVLAVALSKNGIYLGVPRLISALKEDRPELRLMAAEHLKLGTGEDFIPANDAPPAEWEKAADRYQSWWLRNQDDIMTYTKAMVSSDASNTPQRIRALQYWLQADDYWQKQQYAPAEAALRQALQTDPTFGRGALSLGILLYRHGKRMLEAESIFKSIAQGKYPAEGSEYFARAMCQLGCIKRDLKQWSEAVSWLRRATQEDTSYHQAFIELGDTYYKWGLSSAVGNQIEKRKTLLTNAVSSFKLGMSALDETDRNLVPVQAERLYGDENMPFSRRDYMLGLKTLKERFQELKKRMLEKSAMAYLALGHLDKAEAQVREAVRLDNQDPAPHILLAMIYERQGKRKEAAREYRVVLTIDENNKIALQGAKRLGTIVD